MYILKQVNVYSFNFSTITWFYFVTNIVRPGFFCSKQVLINTNVAVVKLLSGVVCRLYYQNAESVDRV